MSIADILTACNRLYWRMTNIIARGRITFVDDSGVIQKLQISLNSNEVRDNIARMGEYGFVSNPPLGTDVAAVFLSGDRSNGGVIGTNNQTARMRGLASGETAMHDNIGKYVYLTENGIIIEANGQSVTVNGATIVTINAATKVRMVTPLLEVTGDIIDNCDTQTDNMGGMRSRYNTHHHTGVQAGSDLSGLPDNVE